MAITRQLHDRMRAGVYVDDGDGFRLRRREYGKDVCCLRYCSTLNAFVATAIGVVIVRFSGDETILKDLMNLQEYTVGGATETPVKGAGGSCVPSRSCDVEVRPRIGSDDNRDRGDFRGHNQTVSEKKTALLMREPVKQAKEREPPPPPSPRHR